MAAKPSSKLKVEQISKITQLVPIPKAFALIFQEAVMPHVQPLSDEQASPPAQALFGKLKSAFKIVPNIFRTMGHAPSVLEATLALNQAIQHDLDAKLRELAYIKTSRINHCNY
jgi:alkylhydroperoxidase family enzyme